MVSPSFQTQNTSRTRQTEASISLIRASPLPGSLTLFKDRASSNGLSILPDPKYFAHAPDRSKHILDPGLAPSWLTHLVQGQGKLEWSLHPSRPKTLRARARPKQAYP